jgi:hypothetical protein
MISKSEALETHRREMTGWRPRSFDEISTLIVRLRMRCSSSVRSSVVNVAPYGPQSTSTVSGCIIQ